MRMTILATTLALAGWAYVPANPEPDPEPKIHVDLVRVASIGTPLSLTDPGVLAASEVLSTALSSRQGMSPDEIVDEMERVLIEAYGAANVSTVELETTYVLIFDPVFDDWVYVCVPSSEFSIDDGAGSPVLATVSFDVPYEVGDA